MTIALSSLPRASVEVEPINTLLQDPEGKIDELVEKYHSQSLSRLLCDNAAVVINRGNGCIIHNYQQTPPPKINQLVIPTGSTRWSYCLLLADDDIKDQIYVACDKGSTSMNLIFGTPITGREEKEHAITLTVKVLPPRRLSPHSEDESLNNLWIIPVVDDRYTWQFAHTGDLSGTVADSSITAPDDAVELLLDQLGVDYINVGVNTVHTITPSCLNKNDYENLPIVLDSIATHYGQRLVADIGSYNTVTGKYDNIEFETSPGGETRWALIDGLNSRYVYDNNLLGKLGLRECVWGGGGESISTNASAANYIVGRPFVVAGGMISSYGTAATPPHVPYASTPSSVDIQTTSGTYVNKTPGTEYKTMAITAIWRTEFDEDPSTGMKDQLGRDYFYQFYRQFDWTFAGVQPWQQGYFDDYMVLRQTWNSKTCQYDAFTRVCSRQPNLTGEWVTPTSGSGAPKIRFTILSASFTVGFGALGCDHVVVLVKHISCGGTGVSVDDEVKVYDPEYCHFNLPIELLVGLSGTATLMKSENYQAGLDYVLYCLDEIRAVPCMWMIDTLCCSEEEVISG